MPAGIAAGLLAVLQLANGVLSGGDAVLRLAVTALPSAAWCWFFLGLDRKTAILALCFAILPQALYSGATLSVVPALLTVCWAAFLIAMATGRGLRWLPAIALPLLLLTALQSLGDLLTIVSSFNELINGSLVLFWRYNPVRTLWRQLVTPGILVFYWVSQMRFLLAVRDE